MSQSATERILRFRQSERALHWAIAVPFMTCYATAVLLVAFYNPHPDRPFREVVSWVHRMSGVCLVVLPLWTVVRHRRDFGLLLDNAREAWTWRLDDLKWLCLIGPSAVSSRIALPAQGKFNAGEKINFMVLMSTYPLYVVTGIMIWLPGVSLPAWILHLSMAAVATPFLLGHLFMAMVNPGSRPGLPGVMSGFVDREWARHHYRRWYDECFGNEADLDRSARPVELPEPHPAPIGRVPRAGGPPAVPWAGLRVRGFEAATRARLSRAAGADPVSGGIAPEDAEEAREPRDPGAEDPRPALVQAPVSSEFARQPCQPLG